MGTGIAWGAGIAQWLQRRTRDRKVTGLSPDRSRGRILFSKVNFLCFYFGNCSTPQVTAIARKRSRSFSQNCRWQVTSKYAYILRIWLCMKGRGRVHDWTVYTERAETAPCKKQTALYVHQFGGYSKRRTVRQSLM